MVHGIIIITQPQILGQSSPAHGSHFYTFPRIEFWPHVEVEAGASFPVTTTRVKVNHIVNPRAAAINNPVVTIERSCVSEDRIESSRRGHSVALVGKGF